MCYHMISFTLKLLFPIVYDLKVLVFVSFVVLLSCLLFLRDLFVLQMRAEVQLTKRAVLR